MKKNLVYLFFILLVFSILLPLSAQRNRGKNPFIKELNDVRELQEKIQKAKKAKTRAKYELKLKLAQKELAAALKKELDALDEFIKKEEDKMKPYKKNIEKLQAEKKRLEILAGVKKDKDGKEAPAKNAKTPGGEADDGIAEDLSEKEDKEKEKKSSRKNRKEKKNKKK